MSTPENSTERTDLETDARAKRDALTGSVGKTLEPTARKPALWKRLLGRG